MDNSRYIHIFCGRGRGKTSAAIGQAILAASEGKSVFVIQFLKERNTENLEYLRQLEPDIKVFRFEKYEKSYQELTPQEREEEVFNLKNGLNFAKKVLSTEESDVVVLDEVLGMVEYGIITEEELKGVIEQTGEETQLIMTGISRCEGLWPLVDEVTEAVTAYRK